MYVYIYTKICAQGLGLTKAWRKVFRPNGLKPAEADAALRPKVPKTAEADALRPPDAP